MRKMQLSDRFEPDGRAAEGITEIVKALHAEGGSDAVNLRIAEQYISEFGSLAKANNTMMIPSNLSDVAGVVATAKEIIGKVGTTA